jgi:DNA polymerase III subunit epsilon
MSWVDGPMLAFDLETTGTDPYSCCSVDMALILHDPGEGDYIEWEWLINPGVDIPLDATAIHGISTEQVENTGIPTWQAMGELSQVINTIQATYDELPPVVIYNAAFDMPILIRESNGLVGLSWEILDPMVIDKSLDTYRPGKRTLTAVSAAYGLAVKNAHRAIGDCKSAMRLMREIGKRYPRLAEKHPREIHAMEVRAYREQRLHDIDYRRKTGEKEFIANTAWPYHKNLLSSNAPVIGGVYSPDAQRD